jgi:hypothetical protein
MQCGRRRCGQADGIIHQHHHSSSGHLSFVQWSADSAQTVDRPNQAKPHSDWLPVRSFKVSQGCPYHAGKRFKQRVNAMGTNKPWEGHERGLERVKAEKLLLSPWQKKKKKMSVRRIIILMAHESGSNNPKQRACLHFCSAQEVEICRMIAMVHTYSIICIMYVYVG